MARQWPENHLTNFKTRFSAKTPGANGLRVSNVNFLLTIAIHNQEKRLEELLLLYIVLTICLLISLTKSLQLILQISATYTD